MKSLRQTAMRLRGVFAGRRAEAEFDEEVQLHLEMLALEHRNRGLSPDDAMLAARRDFGGVARMTERYREQQALPFFDTRAAGRQLCGPALAPRTWVRDRRHCGARTRYRRQQRDVYAGRHAALPPVTGSSRQLVGVYSHDPSVPNSYRLFSYPNFVDIRDRGGLFEHVIAFTAMTVGVPQGEHGSEDVCRSGVEQLLRRAGCAARRWTNIYRR
jgi:hypothetical protein